MPKSFFFFFIFKQINGGAFDVLQFIIIYIGPKLYGKQTLASRNTLRSRGGNTDSVRTPNVHVVGIPTVSEEGCESILTIVLPFDFNLASPMRVTLMETPTLDLKVVQA